jgi:ABC transporter with metal-binding/Fe-S-binding domain ATP-binding protein
MRLASLFSGGKDSTYATHLAQEQGHEIECLFTVEPRNPDSWMFHTVNLHLTPLLAQAWGIKSVTVDTEGTKERELEDLERAISKLDIDGLVTGAIASNYQRSRVDSLCTALGLEHVAPLWGRDAGELLDEMISAGLVIVVTAVAAMGLDSTWLGRFLDDEASDELKKIHERFGVDVCGEGGEMETLVVDAPWFMSRLELVQTRPEWDEIRGAYLVEEAKLIPKDSP